MKLSDIDEMQKVKAEYIELTKKLGHLEYVKDAPCNISIGIAGQAINVDYDSGMAQATKNALANILKKRHDELVSKLMLWGVEDWKS